MGKSVNNKSKLHRISLWVLIGFVISIGITGYSQEKDIQKSNQQWLQLSHRSKLENNWIWNFDTGYRWKNGFDESTQYYVRSSFGYEFTPSISLSAGFNFVGYKLDGETVRFEYRPYQDFVATNKYSKFTMSHRFRVEERWFKSTEHDQNDLPESFSMRFRYRILFAVPLLKPKPSGRMFSLVFGDEIFLNAGKDIVNNVFDQNRILVSPTYVINKRSAITFTYSKQFAGTPKASTYLRRNLYWVRLSHYFDTRKK